MYFLIRKKGQDDVSEIMFVGSSIELQSKLMYFKPNWYIAAYHVPVIGKDDCIDADLTENRVALKYSGDAFVTVDYERIAYFDSLQG